MRPKAEIRKVPGIGHAIKVEATGSSVPRSHRID
jgi:hypothetical protein